VTQRLRAGVLLAMLWVVPSRAAAEFQFDSWTTENGLPQNSGSLLRLHKDNQQQIIDAMHAATGIDK
jgi:hypothetical protein